MEHCTLGTGPDPAPYLDQNGQQVTSTGTHLHTLGTLARDKFDLEHSGDQDTSTKVTERSNFRKRTEIRNVTRNWSNGDSSRGRVFTEGTSTKSEKTTSTRANGLTMPFHLDRLSKSNSSRNENSGGVSGGVTRSLTSESRSTYQKKEAGTPQSGTGEIRVGYGHELHSRNGNQPPYDITIPYTEHVQDISWPGSSPGLGTVLWDDVVIGSLNLLGDGLDFVRDAALGIVWELGLTSRDTTLYLRSHSQDLFRIAGGVIDLAISTTFSWTGLSVALAGVGIDQIVTGFMNIANNTRSNSPIEMIVGNLTGSQTIGQLAPGVLSLGLWGVGSWYSASRGSIRSGYLAEDPYGAIDPYTRAMERFRQLRSSPSTAVVVEGADFGLGSITATELVIAGHGISWTYRFLSDYFPAARRIELLDGTRLSANQISNAIRRLYPNVTRVQLVVCDAALRPWFGLVNSIGEQLSLLSGRIVQAPRGAIRWADLRSGGAMFHVWHIRPNLLRFWRLEEFNLGYNWTIFTP